MTLILSMNSFCDHVASEGASEISPYQTLWETEYSKNSSISEPIQIPQKGIGLHSPTESHYRGISNPVTTSKIAYFKRKYVEDEDFHPSLYNGGHKAVPVLEERTHVLSLSLEKLKFIDDPEVFLRRSVLINNLLKRIRGEIIMQNEWCFSGYTFGGASPQDWFTSQDCPYRKRLRMTKEEYDGFHACCFFQDGGGRYLSMPFSVCTGGEQSLSSSSPLPSCSGQSDPCMDHAVVYRSIDQASSTETLSTKTKVISLRDVAKYNDNEKCSEPNWERDRIILSCEQVTADLPKGSDTDFQEVGSEERINMSESWRESLRKKDSITGDKHCCKK
ncbi:SERTA domain-containing protein 4 [Latimeria chalumnae]|uniref:SERTA domain-containing protein 4 n=1 Tax=Latimeria chalumnae TaxID=7897 RepID=UPI0006D8F46B|nr:PREDICTED: SERTA domain-containing protein 4 [Latimeria chalumnae]XP_014350875.1 PREDICTED: SERTA domain-containing protein 4 [Latimeria chalumnae]|eukprot:XP_006007431.2 PREDICTED: SERTA domain-containing protein 4 [Latimeria chalumnae]